ncbi:hypothetical protein [Anoxynatronum sibiricum]|uniref:hypothetical protein n=1 Tax=Anoxynatronum sibiricum TaxID=210623 RepID=UPI0031B85943
MQRKALFGLVNLSKKGKDFFESTHILPQYIDAAMNTLSGQFFLQQAAESYGKNAG